MTEADKYVAYGLVILAVFALVWALFGRGDGGGGYRFAEDRKGGWNRLPSVFKMLWVISVTYENPLGMAIANRLSKRAESIGENVRAAALPLTPARVFCSSLFLSVMMAFVGLAVGAAAAYAIPWRRAFWMPLPMALMLGAFGWYWPIDRVRACAIRRRRELTRQLPFAIDLVTSAMRSGLEFSSALRYYVNCGVQGALPEEFGWVLAELQVGKTLAEALDAMSRRIGLAAFTSFSDAVAYGQDVGAPVTRTLKVYGSELRRERFSQAEQKAARAPHLMIFPLICLIMPAVFIVVLTPVVMEFMKMFHRS